MFGWGVTSNNFWYRVAAGNLKTPPNHILTFPDIPTNSHIFLHHPDKADLHYAFLYLIIQLSGD